MDKDTFYAVQEMIEENHKKDAEKSASRKYKFTGKLFCCDCGWRFKKRVQNGISYWTCSKNGTVGQRCITHHLSEEVIERTFCDLYNKLRQYENELLKSTLNRLIELKAAITKSKSEIFLSIAKTMVYHHASACISSPKAYIITQSVYLCRLDYMQFRGIDDIWRRGWRRGDGDGEPREPSPRLLRRWFY